MSLRESDEQTLEEAEYALQQELAEVRRAIIRSPFEERKMSVLQGTEAALEFALAELSRVPRPSA